MKPTFRMVVSSRSVRVAVGVASATLTTVLSSGVAHAAERCEEGDWFCEPSTSPPESEARDELPPESAAPEPPERGEPPRVRYRHSRRDDIELDEPWEPPPPPRMRRARPRFRRWGLGAHAFGAIIGGGQSDSSASMGGVGMSLRYRFIPHFGVQGDAELAFGTDYNGLDRQEGSLLFNAVGILNPRSFARLYLLGGFGASWAHVSNDRDGTTPPSLIFDDHYSYFGLDLGAGVEIRLAPATALNIELLGFVRDRTDPDRDRRPEFTDPDTGRTTNASGGGLLRFGAMFYF